MLGPHGPTSNIKCIKMIGPMSPFFGGHSGSSPSGTLHTMADLLRLGNEKLQVIIMDEKLFFNIIP